MNKLSDTIEKRYTEYLDKVKEWSDDMTTGKEGECNLCGKKAPLTEHHLVPKRAFKKRTNPQLQLFLEKLTIDICNECHNYIHPENIWKKDLLNFQQMYEAETKRYQIKVDGQLLNKEKAVSEAIQDRNNIQIKLNNKIKSLEEKNELIKKQKEDISKLKKTISAKVSEIDELKKLRHSDDDAIQKAEQDAHIMFNILSFYQDDKKFRKELKKEILKKIEQEKAYILRKESPSPRDIKMMLDKLQKMPLFFEAYDDNDVKGMTEILGKIFAEEFDEAMMEAFNSEEFEIQKVDKKKGGKKDGRSK